MAGPTRSLDRSPIVVRPPGAPVQFHVLGRPRLRAGHREIDPRGHGQGLNVSHLLRPAREGF